MSAPSPPRSEPSAPRLHGWLHPAILAAAALLVASGFAQFGVIAALADVAALFGEAAGGSEADQVLSGTALGLGLATIRAAALGGLPLAGVADRYGRRGVVLGYTMTGLALTALAALAPAFVVFVALFALARPLLSATNAVAGVIAAEETRVADRSKAIALITAAYGLGSGLTTIVRALFGEALGPRGLFALCVVPLLLVPLVGRLLEEPDRFRRLQAAGGRGLRLGAVHPDVRVRLMLLCGLTFTATFVATPVTSFVFAYAEGPLGLPVTIQPLVALLAGLGGLAGFALGIPAADRIGRRWTSAVLHVIAGAAAIALYAGSTPLALVSYVLLLGASSAYAPAVGALSAEIFPTADRATAAGWITASGAVAAVLGLISFGVLLDIGDGYLLPAVVVSIPVILSAPLYLLLPETRGMELEESAPDTVP